MEYVETQDTKHWSKKALRRTLRHTEVTLNQALGQLRIYALSDHRSPDQVLKDEYDAWRAYGVRKALELHQLRVQYSDLQELYQKIGDGYVAGPDTEPLDPRSTPSNLPSVPPGGRGGVD